MLIWIIALVIAFQVSNDEPKLTETILEHFFYDQFIFDFEARSTYPIDLLVNQIIMFWSAMWAPYDQATVFPVKKCVFIADDSEGNALYVGRAIHNSDLIPGMVIPDKKICCVAYNGKEISVDKCEVLLNDNYSWIESSDGAMLENAVVGGSTNDGETLFIGRVWHEGHLVAGKVHPSHKCLYIPFRGAEHAHEKYEILVKEEGNDLLVPIAIDSSADSKEMT